MRFSMRRASIIGLLIAGSYGLPTIAVSVAQSSDRGEPKSLEEGMARLEALLGRNDAEQQVEWRVPSKFEHETKPEPSKPAVLQVFSGVQLIGRPFREVESISFDVVAQWDRRVYDLGEGGQRTLTNTQRSHNVMRYSLTFDSGVWLVDATMLSNGVHSSIGKPAFQGTVKWHPDGIEFVGSNNIDHYYAAGGRFILGIAYGSIRYLRDGDQIIIKTRTQPYHLSKSADGTILVMPDLKRPFGSRFESDFRSDPLTPPGQE